MSPRGWSAWSASKVGRPAAGVSARSSSRWGGGTQPSAVRWFATSASGLEGPATEAAWLGSRPPVSADERCRFGGGGSGFGLRVGSHLLRQVYVLEGLQEDHALEGTPERLPESQVRAGWRPLPQCMHHRTDILPTRHVGTTHTEPGTGIAEAELARRL